MLMMRYKILFLVLMTLQNALGRDCNFSGGDKAVFDATLKLSNAALAFVPVAGDTFNYVLELKNIFDDDGRDMFDIIQCHLQNYHFTRLLGIISTIENEIDNAKTSCQLENIRQDIESASTMGELLSNDKSIKAAVYPILSTWAGIHLKLYKKLVAKEGNKYAAKNDEYVEFYVKLILRYWRYYRDEVLQDSIRGATFWNGAQNSLYNNWKKPSVLTSPAEYALKDWPNLAISSRSKKNVQKLLDSCKVKKGSHIMMQFLGKDEWFSCWGSGNHCHYRTCPANVDDIFEYGDQFQYGYHCRGELFWIYADSTTIYHNTEVHVKYSNSGNKGYWVSRIRGLAINEFDTKTCPGRSYAGIRRDCDSELFQIRKESTRRVQDKQSSAIYDGNVITLTRVMEFKHIIYKEGAETNNPNGVTKPAFVSLLKCKK